MKKTINLSNKTVLLSRTDSIGDVVLTLPMCIWIKKNYPTAKVIFLGNHYTQPVLACLPQIDEILNWSDIEHLSETEQIRQLKEKNVDVFIHVFPRKSIASLAKKANIPIRVGTLSRLYHLFTCNIRPYFSRVKSDLHESQLNFELLRPFGFDERPSLTELSTWMTAFQPPKLALPDFLAQALSEATKSVIVHPKSQGSAREWPIARYMALADELIDRGYSVFFTGTENEGAQFRHLIPKKAKCVDTTGKLSLPELITFISQSDALVACSTGPLHLAGVLGRYTIGLYSPRRPIHPGRWRPLGTNCHILVNDVNCAMCKAGQNCQCIEQITPERIVSMLAE